jgi:hypothetical protein
MWKKTLLPVALLLAIPACKSNRDEAQPANKPTTTESSGATGPGTTSPTPGSTTAGSGATGSAANPSHDTSAASGAATGNTTTGNTGSGSTATGNTGSGSTATGDTMNAPGRDTPAAMRLVTVDCSTAGAAHKGWTTSAPEGARCQQTANTLVIAAGDSFQLVVHDTGTDLTARRKAIQSDTTHKLKRFISEQPDTLVYETESPSGATEVHFVASKTVSGKKVMCEDAKGKRYTQEQIEAMAQACQGLTKK